MTPAVLLQHLLPHRLLSWLVRRATRWTWRPWKNALIDRVVRSYDVDMGEAAQPDAHAYASFNAFFTRALRAGARPAEDEDPRSVLCPADGAVSQAGPIAAGRIIQAKAHDYSVAELFADDEAARAYHAGCFVTIYLSPRDYHRVHMPLAGRLLSTAHVPGRIFSVAPFAVRGVPRVFARNERLVCHFQGEHGPFAVVMVGAMLVSGVQTVWRGEEIPPYARRIQRRDYRDADQRLGRLEEMARFNMGSTVIVLLPAGSRLREGLHEDAPVRLGRRLGRLAGG
ncbi:MAG TPA: archaetidylserine decarboxylase [Rhodanobacteraceae bacterium]|nr:archaetidylserine decarboxylase [Rhodanobacteraceae bacterium]